MTKQLAQIVRSVSHLKFDPFYSNAGGFRRNRKSHTGILVRLLPTPTSQSWSLTGTATNIRGGKMSELKCDGCRACYMNDALFLHPECGDSPEEYETVGAINPLTGKKQFMLAHKPNGECVYLGESGCTIYERRPAICREFDCRKMFKRFDRDTRRLMVRKGLASKAVMDAGRKRLRTLEE